MSIGEGDTAIVMRGIDGAPVAYPLRIPTGVDDLSVISQTKTGTAAIRTVSMAAEDDVGSPIRAHDGAPVAVKGGTLFSQFMLMVFIDEAVDEYFPNGTVNWDADLADWNAYIAAKGPPQYGLIGEVREDASPPEGGVKPVERDFPPEFLNRTVDRRPDLAEMLRVYNDAKGGSDKPHPRKVYLFIDNSGSMYRSDLEPGISDFEDWLYDGGGIIGGPPIPWEEVSFGDEEPYVTERWLKVVVEIMQSLYP